MSEISGRLLEWYDLNARRMPWRGAADEYGVWISEIMLQQTQVDTVIPYYLRWMQRFPTLADLAAATEQDVLQLWEGLGYYSRARNLLKAARRVVKDYDGKLPSDRRELQTLPGIGPYTAGAIASIAFGLDEATLDGNIRRVMARLFNVEIPARSPEGEKLLWSLVSAHLPSGRAGDYNQALMDLGATICTPATPACRKCPLEAFCQARALGVQLERPVLPVRPVVPHYIVTAAVIQNENNHVLIAQRPPNGLLGGLWEFPGGKLESGESLPEGLKREIVEELAAQIEVGAPFGVYRHAYTHYKVTLHAFLCRLKTGQTPQALEASELRWVSPGALASFPMGKIDRQIAGRLEQVNEHT
ncbi:MAG: A/G-specific adenine glycosylase [Anaerolineae bacterium]|nr:A/G-specific adenine glycosylase [Anaerolineae bacterium]